MSQSWEPVAVAPVINNIRNLIREVVQTIDFATAQTKSQKFINLGLGDPSVFGNLPPPPEAVAAIQASLNSKKADGYPTASVGLIETRQAIADYFDEPEVPVKAQDVFLTHGTSGGVEATLSVLASPGKNVLMPKPFFSAYETIASPTGCGIKFYKLLPEDGWKVDLADFESQIDENTVAAILNNPANPCGSNYSRAHLEAIAAIAEKHHLLIISDEVYGGMVWDVEGGADPKPAREGHFNPGPFVPYASVSPRAPVLVLGGLSKRWLAPGWRCGWIIVHDPVNVLGKVREGFARWTFRIQGPSTTVQYAIPEILKNTPQSFFDATNATLKAAGDKLFDRLAKIDGLEPVRPQGAMYLMCKIPPQYTSDTVFMQDLYEKQNVFVLPGTCFALDGYVRFVTTVPVPLLLEAADRIEAMLKA